MRQSYSVFSSDFVLIGPPSHPRYAVTPSRPRSVASSR